MSNSSACSSSPSATLKAEENPAPSITATEALLRMESVRLNSRLRDWSAIAEAFLLFGSIHWLIDDLPEPIYENKLTDIAAMSTAQSPPTTPAPAPAPTPSTSGGSSGKQASIAEALIALHQKWVGAVGNEFSAPFWGDPPPKCAHSWRKYEGLTERYQFCETCDQKRGWDD